MYLGTVTMQHHYELTVPMSFESYILKDLNSISAMHNNTSLV